PDPHDYRKLTTVRPERRPQGPTRGVATDGHVLRSEEVEGLSRRRFDCACQRKLRSARTALLLYSASPRLRAMRGRRAPRIVGPGMPRVAPLQFLLHLGVGALPEAFQILCHLDRPARGREQVQGHRYAAA